MDFSLGKNSLDNYINLDKNEPREGDSFRSIKEYSKLEAYLTLKKEENENMLNVVIIWWRNYGRKLSGAKLPAWNFRRMLIHRTVG